MKAQGLSVRNYRELLNKGWDELESICRTNAVGSRQLLRALAFP